MEFIAGRFFCLQVTLQVCVKNHDGNQHRWWCTCGKFILIVIADKCPIATKSLMNRRMENNAFFFMWELLKMKSFMS